MNLSVIITAGGIGKRFSSEVPKQFLSLIGTPVLMHTINTFHNWGAMTEIILTVPKEWASYWEKLIKKHDFKIPHRIVDGGKERYHSIKNALDMCSGDYVMIHDGVRPLVDKGTLNRCRNALKNNKPLIIPGTINAYSAKLAELANHNSIYLSGSGVAAASYGLPDLGVTTLENVLIDAKRITSATSLPLLVDIDTGWGDFDAISNTIIEMGNANVAAVHIEDQIFDKRCGHRPNKQLVSTDEMQDRLKAALDAKIDDSFFIMARTDALASEGIEKAIERCGKYLDVGADGIFFEAAVSIEEYKEFKNNFSAPLLANITEFGKTPLFTQKELSDVGVDMVLYPLTAFRAMSLSAEKIYNSIIKDGTQEPLLDIMQTREELYEVLDYYNFEKQLDEQFENNNKESS